MSSSPAEPASEVWSGTELRDQHGRTFVITGANSGLGLEAARAFGRAGGHVVLAVRDTAKGDAAARTIDGSTEVRRLDLADRDSVQEFADGYDGSVDVLVNNAGIMGIPLARTREGFECQLATNHLGHFALTNLLLPRITQRVITMSSLMHKMGSLDLDDLSWYERRYRRWQAYSASKLANLLFAAELQRKLAAVGSPVLSLAAHPGYASTNLQAHTGNLIDHVMLKAGNLLLSQSAEQGALPILYAATADLPPGAYVGPTSLNESRGAPGLASRSRRAADETLAANLWTRSEEMTGVSFGLGDAA